LNELAAEKFIPFRPAVGPVTEFDAESRYRIEFLDARLPALVVLATPEWALKDVINLALLSQLTKKKRKKEHGRLFR
jgi:hypothetical protein